MLKVWCVSISPDSRWLVSSSVDGWVCVWDMAPVYEKLSGAIGSNTEDAFTTTTNCGIGNGAPLLVCTMRARDGIPIVSVPASAGSAGPQARTCDTDGSETRREVPVSAVHAVSWSSDGRFLLGCSADRSRDDEGSAVYCWEITGGNNASPNDVKLLSTVRHHEGGVGTAKFVPKLHREAIHDQHFRNIDCSSLESMKQLDLFVSIGESDKTMLLCDIHSGTSLAELSETDPFGDLVIISPLSCPAVGDLSTSDDVEYCAGFVLYVSAEKSIKMCKIELCKVNGQTSVDIGKSGALGEVETGRGSVSYYFRIVYVCAVAYPHVIMTIGVDCARHCCRSCCAVLSFADGHGCALIDVDVSVFLP
jgi:WD40 repeat protein